MEISMNPDNLSLSEIAETLGVTPGALSQWQKRHDDFPLPVESNGRRRTYRLADIKAFIARHDLQVKKRSNKERDLVFKTSNELRDSGYPAGIEMVLVIATFAALWASRKFLLVEIAKSGKIPPQIWSISTKQTSGQVSMDVLYSGRNPFDREIDESRLQRIAGMWLEDLGTPTDQSRKEICGELFRFAISAISQSGFYSTSKSLSQLMNKIGRGLEILDISTGIGAILNTYDKEARLLVGQDTNAELVQLQQLLDAIMGDPKRLLIHGDSLQIFEEKWVNAFDVVLCDPPLGKKDVSGGFNDSDPRWTYFEQTSTQSEMDYWIQTVLAYLRPAGAEKPGFRGIVVVNESWLFIAGEQAMRTALIRRGQIEAVIRLGEGLANGTSIPLNLLILRKSEQPGASVRLIDASEIGNVVRGKRTLSESDILDIVQVLNADAATIQLGSNKTIFCRDVSFEELLENEAVLLPRRYQPIETTSLDPLAVLQELDTLLKSIEKKLAGLSKALETNQIKNEITDISSFNSTEVRQVSIGETNTNSAPFEILFKNRPLGTEWTNDDVFNLDIVICLTGPQIGESMIGSDFVAAGANWSRIAQLRIKGRDVSIEYLMAWLTNGDFKAQVERLAGGTVLRTISKKDLNRIIIPIPSAQVQATLGSIANQVETLNKATQDVAELNSQMNLRLEVLLSVLLAMIANGQ
jgi:hypothetical protein